ncbi:hypothetical protein AAUPMC_00985, partial [Pasteurella multocida subsp. multocida str. Anand1_cattle]
MERAVILKRDKTAAEGAKRAVNFSVFQTLRQKDRGNKIFGLMFTCMGY